MPYLGTSTGSDVVCAPAIMADHLHPPVEVADGADGREVTGNGGLGAQELSPGNTRALRGGVDAVLFEDSPHSGGSNAVTETSKLAGDAAVAPGGVVGGHLDDETTQLHRSAGPPGRPAGLSPVAGHSASVPTQQGLWCDEPASSPPSRQGRRDRTQQGPVLIGERWPVGLSAQDCELVAEHDDLKVFRASRAHSQARQRHQQPVQNATHGPQDRQRRICSARHDRVFGQPKTPRMQRIVPGQRTRPHFRAPTGGTRRLAGPEMGSRGRCLTVSVVSPAGDDLIRCDAARVKASHRNGGERSNWNLCLADAVASPACDGLIGS